MPSHAQRGCETEAVRFKSDDLTIVGDLHLPTLPASGGWPAVVIAPGWGGNRAKSPTRIARDLANLEIAALTLDFRGFGDSAGERHRLFPSEQARDVRAGAAFLATIPAIDARRIFVMGMLTGAAAAVLAAAGDQSIAGVVAIFPFANGNRWLRSMRRHWEWVGFQKLVEWDRDRRSAGQPSLVVNADEILMRGPESVTVDATGRFETQADRPSREQRLLTVESAEQLSLCRPEDVVADIAPRPVLVVAVRQDLLVPVEESEALFNRARQPKTIRILDGISHHEAMADGHRSSVLTAAAELILGRLPADEDTLSPPIA